MIKLELKAMKTPFIAYCLITVIFILLLLLSSELFLPRQLENGYIQTPMFYFTDFFLPMLACSCVVMQFGNSLEKNTFMFACSLPKSNKIIFRWLFTLVAVFIPHFFSSLFAYRTLTDIFEMQITFSRFIFLNEANLLLFCSTALLLVILFRQIFYVFTVLFGYACVDFFINKVMFSEFSVFANIAAKCAKEAITVNRIVVYIISAAAFLICVFMEKTKFLQKINKMV